MQTFHFAAAVGCCWLSVAFELFKNRNELSSLNFRSEETMPRAAPFRVQPPPRMLHFILGPLLIAIRFMGSSL